MARLSFFKARATPIVVATHDGPLFDIADKNMDLQRVGQREREARIKEDIKTRRENLQKEIAAVNSKIAAMPRSHRSKFHAEFRVLKKELDRLYGEVSALNAEGRNKGVSSLDGAKKEGSR